jgi:hypothetical protein
MTSLPAPPNESGSGGPPEQQAVSLLTTAVLPLASPLASDEAYDNICGICFTEIHLVDNPRGRLNSCNHLFCSYCIKEWSKNTNVCPSCKARFTRIYTYNTETQREEETKVRRRNYKAWELTYYDDDDDEEGEGEEEWEGSALRTSSSQEQVVCDICQQSHNAARMIFCDRRQCPYAAHLDCLGLAERPVTFLCPRCTQLRDQESGSNSSSAPGTAVSQDAEDLLMTSTSATARKETHPTLTAAAATARRATPLSTATPTPTVAMMTRGVGARRVNPPTVSRSEATQRQQRSRALYGGSRSNSCTSSSRSSSSASSSPTSFPRSTARRTEMLSSSLHARAPSVAVPREPIDFSKPHLLPFPAPLPSTRTVHRSSRPASSAPTADEVGDDAYYFLSPTSHAVAASIELEKTRASRAAEAQTRRQRERAKADRLEAIYGVSRSNLDYHGSRKRPQRAGAEEFATELNFAEKELTDPQLRRAMEERMVRRWTADILPVLRRRRYIDGDTVTSEADMWNQATAQARKMVREKLDAKGAALRRRREQLVRAQANRESAALAKLARIIAQHREREQKNHPHT